MTRRLTFPVLLIAALAGCGGPQAEISGEAVRWNALTFAFEGPETSEQGDPNPFTEYRLTVEFTHRASGKNYAVQGYYAADGDAAETSADSGNQWHVKFAPDEEGEWRYRASFRTGPMIAINGDPEAGDKTGFDGASGSFTAGPADTAAPGFLGRGFRRYVDGHYLRFDDGGYYLKGGADSPENFLAYFEFDGTYDTDVHEGVATDRADFLHKYEPHAGDWNQGDPTWQGGKGKNIIGALNYLASQGMNSVYFLTYNIDGGDGRDTWPWTSHEERWRFDVSKLAQWEIVFSHMDRLGIQLHVVLQETENDMLLGGDGFMNPVRRLYLRELVARFAHHRAVMWNMGEENNTWNWTRHEMSSYIRELDPYNHPVTVHSKNRRALELYMGLYGFPNIEATSIQGEMSAANAEAIEIRRKSRQAGRPWAIFHDEQTPASTGVKPDADDPDHDEPRTLALWGNLMGGGSGVEWYFGYAYPHMDLNAEDWRSRANMWKQTKIALDFFQEHLPFWEMDPDNLLATPEGQYVFAKPGEVYAVYLPRGGMAELLLEAGDYSVHWYDPRKGGSLQTSRVTAVQGPGTAPLGTPPAEPGKDWAVVVRKR